MVRLSSSLSPGAEVAGLEAVGKQRAFGRVDDLDGGGRILRRVVTVDRATHLNVDEVGVGFFLPYGTEFYRATFWEIDPVDDVPLPQST